MFRISIVVPVYNAQNWIKKCIESLISQTEPNIEIILVDDKSTDDSLAICEEYAIKDKRIHIVQKENGGPHSARKAGTKAATAEYVMYVDSDDWIEPDMAEKLYVKIKGSNSQCLICGYIEHYKEQATAVKNKIKSGIYTGARLKEELFAKMLCPEASFEQRIAPALWGKLFLRENMSQIMDEVDEDIWIGEDLACTIKYLLHCSKIQIDNDEKAYHYMVRENTITTKYDKNYFDKAERLGNFLTKTVVEAEMEFLRDNINYYKIFLLYREVGVALGVKDKKIFKQYLNDMENAADSKMYQDIKKQIQWKELKVTGIEKKLLKSLLYGKYFEFRIICNLLYWNRNR